MDADEGLNSPYLDKNRSQSGMPEFDELMDHYAKIAGWDPRTDNGGKDMDVAKIFHLVRVSIDGGHSVMCALTLSRVLR